MGVSDDAYVIAVIGRLAAGEAVCIGFALLVYRRLRFARVRAVTTRADVITMRCSRPGSSPRMLATIANFGDAVTVADSRPYFRQLFIGDPEPELMTGGEVTFIFQAHMTVVWLLVAFWPLQPPGPHLERPGRLPAPPARSRTGRAPAARGAFQLDWPGSRPIDERRREAGRNLALATIAFALSLGLGDAGADPGARHQDELGLSDTETSVMISIPVVLGSLLRLPVRGAHRPARGAGSCSG